MTTQKTATIHSLIDVTRDVSFHRGSETGNAYMATWNQDGEYVLYDLTIDHRESANVREELLKKRFPEMDIKSLTANEAQIYAHLESLDLIFTLKQYRGVLPKMSLFVNPKTCSVSLP